MAGSGISGIATGSSSACPADGASNCRGSVGISPGVSGSLLPAVFLFWMALRANHFLPAAMTRGKMTIRKKARIKAFPAIRYPLSACVNSNSAVAYIWINMGA